MITLVAASRPQQLDHLRHLRRWDRGAGKPLLQHVLHAGTSKPQVFKLKGSYSLDCCYNYNLL